MIQRNVVRSLSGVLLLVLASVLAGCGRYDTHLDTMLHEYACEKNSAVKVGPKREVILFVRHHIMVGDADPENGQWDEQGFTRTPLQRISWENTRFVRYRRQVIDQLMRRVNEIFYDNRTHVFLVDDGVEILADPTFFPAQFDLLGHPRGATRRMMRDLVADEPEYLHILYGWTSLGGAQVAGEDHAVVVADDPRHGTRVTGEALAREIIHALGYVPETGDLLHGNLMHPDSTGDHLGSDQVRALWQRINEEGRDLKSISCAPDRLPEDQDGENL